MSSKKKPASEKPVDPNKKPRKARSPSPPAKERLSSRLLLARKQLAFALTMRPPADITAKLDELEIAIGDLRIAVNMLPDDWKAGRKHKPLTPEAIEALKAKAAQIAARLAAAEVSFP